MDITLIILVLVLFFITCQQLFPILIPIWLIMLLGAIANMVFQQITLISAWHAINWNVMGFLLGVFVLAQFLEQVRITGYMTNCVLKKHGSKYMLLFSVIVIAAFSSMLLMNDAVAIIGVPVCLRVAKALKMKSTPWLLALAFSVTIGSVMSPIGNPQNLLIAVSGGVPSPFIQYAVNFFWPSVCCLLLLFVFILIRYRSLWRQVDGIDQSKIEKLLIKKKDIVIATAAVLLFVLGVVTKVIIMLLGRNDYLPFCWIALTSILPIILFYSKRVKVVRYMDWRTLLFFIAMFIVMKSVWQCALVQGVVLHLPPHILTVSGIMAVSTLLSQFVSNVPTAALYLPVLTQLGAKASHYLALVCGATISGMLTIVGAASNVIILQNVQQRGKLGFSAFEFMAIGMPLGLVCLVIYYLFLVVF